MSLKDKKSKYDRHVLGELGNSIGGPDGTGPNPADGPYHTLYGVSDSPFVGTSVDHMVHLLNNTTTTQTGNKYLPSPSISPFQDIEGLDINTQKPPQYQDNGRVEGSY